MSSIGSRDVRVACLSLACVLLPASALAASADYFLKLEGVDGESTNDKHKGEIEIQSYSWGATQMGSGGAGAGGMGAGKVNMQDISLMRGPRQSAATDGAQVATGDVDGDGIADSAAVSPRDAASGLPTGKRMHKPITISKPLETGSMTMNMKLPGCAVGKRYPSAVLSTPEGRYELQDLVVASCGGGSGGAAPMEQVSLNYTKVKVRGWNPEKKED